MAADGRYRLVGFALALMWGCDCGAGGGGASATGTPSQPDEGEPTQAADPERVELRVDDAGCAEGVAPLAPHVQRGVCYAHNYQDRGAKGYGSERSRETLRALRELGVEWVSLTPFGFMRSLDEPRVHHVGDMPAGETDARMRAEIEQAREAGMKVLLKPHIWVRGGAWRGRIDPGSPERWEAWLTSYEEWILGYARMAEAHDVPTFAIGAELVTSAERFPDRWRAIAEAVRNVYDGEIVYAANWNVVPDLEWWDAVDYIGIQFYPPLSDDPDATETQMRERMDYYAGVIEELSEEHDRPVLFTEVGYKSVEDTWVQPHRWPEHLDGEPEVSEAHQALAYRVFVEAVAHRRWNRGIYIWKTFTNPDTEEEGPAGFSPRGKLAEAVLRASYGAPGCRRDP